MKRLCIIPLIVILTACVTSPTPATPTPKIETATVVPATETPIPTDTPIPTNTVEPTPTRDPSIPAEYIKDSSGNYTKTENGVTITWDSERKAGYSLMFDDFLMDHRPAIEGILPDTLGLKVFIDIAIVNWNTLTVTHKENMDPSPADKPTLSSDSSVRGSVIVENFLHDKMVWRGLIENDGDFDYDKWYKSTDGYTVHYNTLEGPQTLILKDGYATTVYIRADYEALKANQENNNFTEATSSSMLPSPLIKYMIKISSDKNGNTIVEMAPNITDALKWSDIRIIEMYLYGFANALSNQDDPLIPRPMSFSDEVAYNNKAYPYFIFTRQK